MSEPMFEVPGDRLRELTSEIESLRTQLAERDAQLHFIVPERDRLAAACRRVRALLPLTQRDRMESPTISGSQLLAALAGDDD